MIIYTILTPMSDISTYYGGSVLAMAGKGCVAIVSDYRLGNSSITVSKSFKRIFQITNKIVLGLTMFLPDAQFFLKKIEKHVALFKLAEGREIEPEEFSSLVSALLYSNRKSPLNFSPIIAGINSENKPYVCNLDVIGCKTEPGNFVAEGTASDNLMGLCEALYREGMESEDLFETSVQAFLNAIDRDALSGWGAECLILSADKCITRSIKGRCD